jgi:hypothetical protein
MFDIQDKSFLHYLSKIHYQGPQRRDLCPLCDSSSETI